MDKKNLKRTSLLDAENEIRYCKSELKKKNDPKKEKSLKERLAHAEAVKKKIQSK